MVQEWFEEHDEFKVLAWPLSSPDLNLIEHLGDVLDKQVQSIEAPPRNSQALNNLLLMSWCQIPEHTFKVYVLTGQSRSGGKRGTYKILVWWLECYG